MSGETKGGASCYLVAETPRARESLGAHEVRLTAFPFRVGRESRAGEPAPPEFVRERRLGTSRPNNDLYLLEERGLMNVSREHFQIETEGEGFALVDRKSTCGTLVEGRLVGGKNRGGRTSLSHGDVIIVGTSESPYVFKFEVR